MQGLTARQAVPGGHKIACVAIEQAAPVVKYGQIIGTASRPIGVGEHVHTHNVAMSDFGRTCVFGQHARPTEPASEARTFQGYRRPTGRVGTRNYVGIVTTVNCSASAAKLLAREAERCGILARYPHVDGIVPIVHGAGCGHATDDEAYYKLQRAIWGHAVHPNFASVLMLGLGCEANQVAFMLEANGVPPSESFQYYILQQEGGTRNTIEKGLVWLKNALAYANEAQRESVPVSEIKLALQCGGSDGYSGITANPALGVATDILVEHGGTAVLAETPEIYGAEHLLAGRVEDEAVGQKLMDCVRWWEDYTARHGSAMNNNPTPGNKAGGLTTILEKSLGAVAKAGSTNLMGVCKYAEPLPARGVVFMDSPGYDPVSITGQVASGCNLIGFTTGRGSCYGNKPVPSIKIASNTPMFQRMQGDMDVNCGTIADGDESVQEVGERIFEDIVAVASGQRTCSERLGVGDEEFIPWQTYAQM